MTPRFSFSTRISLLILLLISSLPALADSLCFAKAKTYYEQLYCEAKSRGHGNKLPGFYDFQRNDEMTQALLLKGPARQLGIALTMPVLVRRAEPLLAVRAPTDMAYQLVGECHLKEALIVCGTRVFHYRANQLNNTLGKRALDESNSIAIAEFPGSYTDGQAVTSYLIASYEHYLDKMLVIGLAEATMAYGTFAYLFNDLHDKGVSFSRRFEKMYFYLKQDKRQLAVNRHAQPPENMTLDDCYPLQKFWVCSRNKKNYLYRIAD
jgi:hypothetical protein